MKALDTVGLALVLFIGPVASSTLQCPEAQGYLSDDEPGKRLGGNPTALSTYSAVLGLQECLALCGGYAVQDCKSGIYSSTSQTCTIYSVDKATHGLVNDGDGYTYYDNLRCGFITTTTTSSTPAAEPSAEAAAEESDFDVFDWISANPAYVAMIGMGVMIVLLTITVIVILCCYGGRDRDRSGGYVKN